MVAGVGEKTIGNQVVPVMGNHRAVQPCPQLRLKFIKLGNIRGEFTAADGIARNQQHCAPFLQDSVQFVDAVDAGVIDLGHLHAAGSEFVPLRRRPCDVAVFVKGGSGIAGGIAGEVVRLPGELGNQGILKIIRVGSGHGEQVLSPNQGPEGGVLFDGDPGQGAFGDGVVIGKGGVAQNHNVPLRGPEPGHFLVERVAQSAVEAHIHHRHPQSCLQLGGIHAKAEVGVAHQDDLGALNGLEPFQLIHQGGLIVPQVLISHPEIVHTKNEDGGQKEQPQKQENFPDKTLHLLLPP